jgi:hypothetical protein
MAASSNALAQLVVYLACLRQSRRVNRGRSDTSVYGVAIDGLSYVFVTITHGGVLKQSRQFDDCVGVLAVHLGHGSVHDPEFDVREGRVEDKR